MGYEKLKNQQCLFFSNETTLMIKMNFQENQTYNLYSKSERVQFISHGMTMKLQFTSIKDKTTYSFILVLNERKTFTPIIHEHSFLSVKYCKIK